MSKHFFNRKLPSSFIEEPDGGLTIRGVVIMAPGHWVSMQGTDTTFGTDVLAKCAGRWEDTGAWTRHPGGAPRDASAKAGAVINPRYDPSIPAVVGDVYLSRRTEASRAMAELVRLPRDKGGITDVSAETILEMDKDGNVTDITFTGLAFVEAGACEVCKIPAYSKSGIENSASAEEDSMADEEEKKAEKEPIVPPASDPPKKEAEMGDDEMGDTEPRTVEGQILDLLLPKLEEMGYDLKGLLQEIMDATGDDIATATAMGKLTERIAMGCPAGAEYGKQIDELKAKNLELEQKVSTYAKQVETVTKPVHSIAAESGEIIVDMRGQSFASMRR